MFTGIIEEVGSIISVRPANNGLRLEISANSILEDVKVGDSIATNGMCLTVTDLKKDSFCVDVMHESLRRSSLDNIKVGSRVNLERAMRMNGRLDGHIVSGHIDGTGEIISVQEDGIARILTISTSEKILRYIIEKGSVAIEGISLTVVSVERDRFKVGIIPHSLQNTNLVFRKSGDKVNIENDMIAKYVEKLLGRGERELTMDFLKENGF